MILRAKEPIESLWRDGETGEEKAKVQALRSARPAPLPPNLEASQCSEAEQSCWEKKPEKQQPSPNS